MTGKKVALVVTCGYSPERGADLWAEGMARYCKHSQLHNMGLLVERDLGHSSIFMNEEKVVNAKRFAKAVAAQIRSY